MTSTDEFSFFTLGSGLPLDGAEATITAAVFEFDNSYAAGACVLKLTYTMEGAEPQNQLYSCGKNWEPIDFGKSVGHSSGKRIPINNQSNYGKLINAFLMCDGHEDAMEVAKARGLEPDSADMWVGLRFKLKSLAYEDLSGKPKTTIVPAAFLGIDGGATARATTTSNGTTSNGATTSAATTAASKATDPDIPADVLAAVKVVALESADFEAFMEAAMGVEGVAGNKVAEKAVMNSKPGSIWATRND